MAGSHRGISLTRKHTPLGPCHRPIPTVPRGFRGGGRFCMGEAPLYTLNSEPFLHFTPVNPDTLNPDTLNSHP